MIKSIYIPDGVEKIIKKTAEKLGVSESRLIQYCIIKTLAENSLQKLADACHKREEAHG